MTVQVSCVSRKVENVFYETRQRQRKGDGEHAQGGVHLRRDDLGDNVLVSQAAVLLLR